MAEAHGTRSPAPRNYNHTVERKLATVLFVDLVGSTELVAARDPEVVRRRVNSFFEHVSHCITTHGGIVEKFAGDAVMAAFGIPQAHEDDAERAVRAASAILDSVRELGLEARIGVEAGEGGEPDALVTAIVTEAYRPAEKVGRPPVSTRGPTTSQRGCSLRWVTSRSSESASRTASGFSTSTSRAVGASSVTPRFTPAPKPSSSSGPLVYGHPAHAASAAARRTGSMGMRWLRIGMGSATGRRTGRR